MDDQPNVPGAFLSGGWTEQKATFILVRFIVVIFALFACGKVVSHFRDQVVLPRE